MSFLLRIKPGAIRGWREEGILASVIGAQAALEGGWGTSKLAKPPYNNHFGIKASSDWTGKVINMPTLEFINGAQVSVNADFRWYDSEEESLLDHARFFTNTAWRIENYKAVVGERDYKKACWALQNAPLPYATDPGYAQKLINIIEQNNLQAWDVEAMSETTTDTVATPVVQTTRSKMVGAELTSAGQEYVKNLPVTVIGDSLGVGTRSHLQLLIATANFDVLGSRQITHATTSLDATKTLQSMKSAGTLKEYVVVIIGTNRGVTEQEINNFVSIAGTERKVIFVDTASEVAHANAVSVFYSDAAKRLQNVFYVNWHLHATPKLAEYYSKDGANGEYIHMTSTGYKKHAEFIAQALYEVATGDFTERTAVTPKVDYYNIETLELKPDGIVTYDAWKVNPDGTSTKYKATRQTEIKGLFSPYGDNSIYNAEANQQQGFGGSVNNSNWLEARYTNTEETDMFKLLHEASVELIDRSTPDVQYTVSLMEMPDTISIGDTGIFVDHDFQPPLYIRARIISISVSRTNPRLNRVILGNVIELHPQKKDQLMTMRDELAVTREDLRNEWINSEQVVAEIITTNGPVLGDKFAETDLMARVLKSGVNITDQFDSFKWQRISGDEASDTAFNQLLESTTQSSVLPVVAKDIIGNQSQFVVRAYNAKNELVHTSEIVLKRVETALWVDTPTPPDIAKDGATWTNPDGTQWVKKDGVWQERVDQETISAVRLEVEGAITEAEQAKQEAIKSKNEAIAEAERLVTEQDTLWQGKMDDYNEQVSQIETDAQSAQTKATQALTDVGISTDLAQTAKGLAQTAIDNASNALTTAQGYSTDVSQAVTDAQNAITQSSQAILDAQNAIGRVGKVEGGLTLVTTTVDDLTGEMSRKLERADVEVIADEEGWVNGTYVSSAINTSVTDIETQLTSYAKRTELNGLATETYVTSRGYQTASEISSTLTQYAKTTQLNGLATETFVTSKGYQTAAQVSTTLSSYATKTDITGMATQTWTNTAITTSANSVTQLITQVKTDPTGTITGYNSLKNNVDSMVQAIGTDGGKIAQMVMTDSLFSTTVRNSIDVGGRNLIRALNSNNYSGIWEVKEEGVVVRGGEGAGNTLQALYKAKTSSGDHVFSYAMKEGSSHRILINIYDENEKEIENKSIPGWAWNIYYKGYFRDISNNGYAVFNAPSETRYITGVVVPPWSAPIVYSTLLWMKLEKGNVATAWTPAPEDKADQSQVTQLAGSWALTLKSGNDVKTQINATTNSIRLKADLIHLSGNSLIDNATIKSAHIETLNANKIVGNTADFNTIRAGVLTAGVINSTHITADNALIDKLFATTALIDRLTSKTAFISQLKAIDLIADKATLVSAGFQALNSNMQIDGSQIKITNAANDYATMNAIPEFRSQDSAGTAAIMGKGRTHYYSGGMPRFYEGTNLDDSTKHGVNIAKGQTWGIYRNSDSYGGEPAQYYTVRAGEQRVAVITRLIQLGHLPDGDANHFVYLSNMVGALNGWPPISVKEWPTLQAGDMVMWKAAILGNSSGVERIWTMGTATNGTTRVYSHVYHVFEAGTSLSSDRRIKHDIGESQVNALDHINSLAFKRYRMNRDNSLIELGLIAQDSGILRVQDDETEGIDLQGSIMLALKGTQELYAVVQAQAQEIKQLKELINS